jgi:GNAT superfamily N-acetyltransferase
VEPRTTVAALELAYEGYPAEIRFSEPALAAFLSRHDIDVERSPLWFDGSEPVSIALLGLHAENAWIGAFGIASRFRGRGLSHGFFDEVVTEARTAGASHVELEVLEQNSAARAVYARAGFLATREARYFERGGRAFELANGTVVAASELATCVAEPPGTPWQSKIRTILRLENPLACVIGNPQRADAFAFFGRYDDGVVVYLADGKPEALAALIDGIARAGERTVAANVRRDSAWDIVLQAIGFEATHTLLVMEREL